MTMLGMGLALSSAILMGGASIFSRRGLQRASFDVLLLTSLAVAAPLYLAAALLSTGFADAPVRGVALAALGGITGSVVGRSLYFLAIRYVGPGKALSINAVSPLFAALLAALVLGEPVTAFVAVGTVGIVAGVVSMAPDARAEVGRAGASVAVLAIPVVAALIFSATVIVRKLALNAHIAPIEAIAVNMSAALVVAGPFVAVRRRGDLLGVDRRSLGNFVVASLLMAIAFGCYFVGLGLIPASVFYPLAQTQPLFAVLFSALFLGELEIVSSRTAVGALFIVGGATLVVLS